MRLLMNELETGLFVDVTGGVEHAVRPQHDLLVPRLTGEAHAFVDQALADAHPPRARFDQQQAQLRHRLRLFDEEYTAGDPAAAFGYPAPLTFRIKVLDEFRGDLRDQRLELFIPTVLLIVEDAMPVRDPARVAGLMRADDVRDFLLRLRAEQRFDGAHRFNQAVLVRRREPAEHRLDLVVRARVELGERFPPFLRQGDDALAPVGFRRLSGDQAALLECGQQTAEVTRVQPQPDAQSGRRRFLALRQFVNNPGFGQGKLTFQDALAQHADFPRVEAVETPHRFDARRD